MQKTPKRRVPAEFERIRVWIEKMHDFLVLDAKMNETYRCDLIEGFSIRSCARGKDYSGCQLLDIERDLLRLAAKEENRF